MEEIKEEIKKIPVDKWKWKHNNLKPVGHRKKKVLRGKFVTVQAYLRKQEKSQMNNLTLHLKDLTPKGTKVLFGKKEKK